MTTKTKNNKIMETETKLKQANRKRFKTITKMSETNRITKKNFKTKMLHS